MNYECYTALQGIQELVMHFVTELTSSRGLKAWSKSRYLGKLYGFYVIDLIYIMYLYLTMLMLLSIYYLKKYSLFSAFNKNELLKSAISGMLLF